MKRCCVLATILTASVSLPAHADDKPAPAGGDQAIGLQILVGGTLDASGSRKTDSFHRVIYKGQMVSQRGEQAKNTDPTHQFTPSDKSDSNDLFFDLVQGVGKVKNDVLNGYGLDKIPLPQLLGPSFRSILRGGASLDGNNANLAFGYETHSFHPLAGLANWIIPGINAEQRWSKGAKPDTVGTLTYRLFLGKAAWAKRKKVPFSFENVMQFAATQKMISQYIDKRPDTDNVDLAKFVKFQANMSYAQDPSISQDKYIATLRQQYIKSAPGYQYALSDAFWVEGDGWWDFVGADHPRAKTFFAVIWSVYRNVSPTANTQFQIRYETGFDRTQPDRINRVLGTLGFVF